MAETVTILGLAELEQRLKDLPTEIKRGGLILRALRSAARIIRDEARKNAPVYHPEDVTAGGRIRKGARAKYGKNARGPVPGALKSGITDLFSREQELTALVRVRSKGYVFAGKPNRTPNYWWLLEFGTSKIPAMKFMRNAFETQKQAAAEQIKQGLADEIQKANDNPTAYAASQQRRRR